MQTLLLGKHNPRLHEIRKAIAEASLTADGLLPIEGPKLIEEALRSNLEVLDVFIRRDVLMTNSLPSLPDTVRAYELEPSVFRSIQSTETSQGIVALVRPIIFSLKEILAGGKVRIVILARLQDPGNVGTILRVAESFGASACIAFTGTASRYNPKTIRACTGSIFRLPTLWNQDPSTVFRALREHEVTIVGSSPAATLSSDSWNWSRSCALVIGNEGGGMSEAETKQCDVLLRIPHNPMVESLNSAVAAAILLYEASRHERISVRR